MTSISIPQIVHNFTLDNHILVRQQVFREIDLGGSDIFKALGAKFFIGPSVLFSNHRFWSTFVIGGLTGIINSSTIGGVIGFIQLYAWSHDHFSANSGPLISRVNSGVDDEERSIKFFQAWVSDPKDFAFDLVNRDNSSAQ